MDAVVKIRDGAVRGSVADDVAMFKGTPYAAPPFGPNRFRPPQPVKPWSGVRDAFDFGPDPPQQLADTMHAAWIAFATNGDPGWPRYDLRRRATMRFDTAPAVVDDPRAEERALWEGFR